MEESIETVGDNNGKDLNAVNFADMIDKLNSIAQGNMKEIEMGMFNPALLAYIGDAVYELFIRTYLIGEGCLVAGELHKRAIGFVEAKSQARIVEKIFGLLTNEEKLVVKRGRNTKTSNTPKNAKVIEYKYATGFESLIGYLYLNNQIERLIEILKIIPTL